jgi:hypothetical protein
MAADLPLRDIHLPEPVGGWPPAPGWWLLLGLLGVGLFLAWRCWQGRRMRRLCLARLNEVAQQPDPDLAAALSRLLRQAVISHFPAETAGLTGSGWLEFLDRPFADRPFTTGVGRCLLDAPYRVDAQFDSEALVDLCRRWLKTLPAQPLWRRRGR